MSKCFLRKQKNTDMSESILCFVPWSETELLHKVMTILSNVSEMRMGCIMDMDRLLYIKFVNATVTTQECFEKILTNPAY